MNGRRRPFDDDSLDIKKSRNRIDKAHKVRVKDSDVDYSKGEKSPYRDWYNGNGNYDPIDPDGVQEGSQPWDIKDMSDKVEEQWEVLEELYPSFKGRQKEVVDLLMEGQTNQSIIALQLGMATSSVSKTLKAIRKKILKKIG